MATGGSLLSSSAHPPPLVVEAIERKYASLISQDVRVYLVIDVSGLIIVEANKKQLVRRVTRLADVTQWSVLDDIICIQMLHKNDQPRDRIFLTGYSHACKLKAAFETVVGVHLTDPGLALSNTQIAKKGERAQDWIIEAGLPLEDAVYKDPSAAIKFVKGRLNGKKLLDIKDHELPPGMSTMKPGDAASGSNSIALPTSRSPFASPSAPPPPMDILPGTFQVKVPANTPPGTELQCPVPDGYPHAGQIAEFEVPAGFPTEGGYLFIPLPEPPTLAIETRDAPHLAPPPTKAEDMTITVDMSEQKRADKDTVSPASNIPPGTFLFAVPANTPPGTELQCPVPDGYPQAGQIAEFEVPPGLPTEGGYLCIPLPVDPPQSDVTDMTSTEDTTITVNISEQEGADRDTVPPASDIPPGTFLFAVPANTPPGTELQCPVPDGYPQAGQIAEFEVPAGFPTEGGYLCIPFPMDPPQGHVTDTTSTEDTTITVKISEQEGADKDTVSPASDIPPGTFLFAVPANTPPGTELQCPVPDGYPQAGQIAEFAVPPRFPKEGGYLCIPLPELPTLAIETRSAPPLAPPPTKAEAKALAQAEAKAKREAEGKAKADAKAEAKAKKESEDLAKADAKATKDAEAKAKKDAEVNAKAQAKATKDAETKAKKDAEAKAKADANAKGEAEAKTKKEAEANAKAEANSNAEAKVRSEAGAKAEAEANVRAAAAAKADAEDRARAEAKAEKGGWRMEVGGWKLQEAVAPAVATAVTTAAAAATAGVAAKTEAAAEATEAKIIAAAPAPATPARPRSVAKTEIEAAEAAAAEAAAETSTRGAKRAKKEAAAAAAAATATAAAGDSRG